ncbi:GntR family transcriptional regulator [Pseudoclavibacter endophyticus]|uniref:PLP-dependent aminotransferase family protein n=1 Tax=Pseudoclavibacter endophyticus TaxID=1778590 RepID=A0A6H9WLU7_9MICO|nr:PLP-dependent aminotransferase family protein [Pseudoclavibacter endophyticus]KAB1648781.1 PLP-dependent aminotransferase family protein [Pseudoclavibacter endophyticus]GGA68541.1 GntR family transcriptional regulator [Pseudoclavibacter endophyticus]
MTSGERGPQTGRTFDPWYSSYAERTAGLAASEVRALFAVASRPEVVSLAGGMPYVKALPEELIDSAFRAMMREHGSEALQYGGGQGIPEVREQILQIMALEGIVDASPDDIVTTTGSQHALDLVAKLFLDPGDVVLAESPSYVGAIGTFRSYQAQIVHVDLDDDGLIPEALEQSIARLRAEGKTLKFLYTIPNFNNPAAVTMSLERRARVLEICKREHILILEDNPYGLLYFGEPAPPAIRSLDAEHVIYLGSFSKILSPGLRVGWALAPHAIREKLILAVESSILSPSTFNQWVVTEYLRQSDWQQQIAGFRAVYKERRDAMDQALREHLPQLSWTSPDGGFFTWLRLTPELDSKEMLPRAVTELVAYTPGTAFYADGRGQQEIRLSFCYPTPDRIRLGVRRLANVINGELELLETFGTAARSRGEDRVTMPPPDIS